MSNTLTLPLLGAAMMLAVVPLAACGQPAPQPRAMQGNVTLQQFIARHEPHLMAADTNGDGKISLAEYTAAAKPGKGNPAKRFARLDTNGDGMLDKAEIDAMLTRQFQKRDTNGDGVLSPAERMAAHGKDAANADMPPPNR